MTKVDLTASAELFGMTRIFMKASLRRAMQTDLVARSTQMVASMRENGRMLFGMERVDTFDQTEHTLKELLTRGIS